ncbi:MAG: hypothetical protein ACIAQF_01520 [Phycisphaerales bacterium JB065]
MTQQTVAELKFDEHCRRSVDGLRSALLELYRAVGADPSRPQDVSRQYKVNRNLAWKVSRIIGSAEPFEAVPMIPGPGGLDILMEAMSNAGAPSAAVERVRKAVDEFDRMIEVHTGDRNQLELVIDSMGRGDDATEMSRKLAFRGNSGVWGIQAGVRVTAHFLAPSPTTPGMLDLAMIGGLTRVCRLRPIERWPVFQIRQYFDDGSNAFGNSRTPLEPVPGEDASDPWLMRSCCSGTIPQIHLSQRGDTILYEIGEGPVGRTGQFSCMFGFADIAAVPRYRDDQNSVGELISSVTVPSEALLFDLFVHRDLVEAMSPSVAMHGTLGGALDSVGSVELPIPETFRDLGFGAMIDTPLVDNYAAAVTAAMSRLGRNPTEFRCLRLLVEHPPMSSRVVARYDLPEQQ